MGVESQDGCMRRCPDSFLEQSLKSQDPRGSWVAQSVEQSTLDLGSGHTLVVPEIERHVRLCADSSEPAWNLSPFLSLCPSPTRACSLSHSLALKISN